MLHHETIAVNFKPPATARLHRGVLLACAQLTSRGCEPRYCTHEMDLWGSGTHPASGASLTKLGDGGGWMLAVDDVALDSLVRRKGIPLEHHSLGPARILDRVQGTPTQALRAEDVCVTPELDGW